MKSLIVLLLLFYEGQSFAMKMLDCNEFNYRGYGRLGYTGVFESKAFELEVVDFSCLHIKEFSHWNIEVVYNVELKLKNKLNWFAERQINNKATLKCEPTRKNGSVVGKRCDWRNFNIEFRENDMLWTFILPIDTNPISERVTRPSLPSINARFDTLTPK